MRTAVSRHGRILSASPVHSQPMHSPPITALAPSATTSFRWSRAKLVTIWSGRSGWKERTSTPAWRSKRHSFREVNIEPMPS